MFVAGASAAELPVSGRDPAAVRGVVQRVLSRPEFRPIKPTLVQRVQSWVADRLQRLLTSVASGGRGVAVTALVVAGGLIALSATVVRFARGLTRDPAGSVRRRVSPTRTVAEWMAEAGEHEGAGRWASGLRCRYRALVGDLAGRGLVEEIPGRTAGEYRGDVLVALRAASADFARATELFEGAWYGNRLTGPEESQQFRSLAEAVVARAAAGNAEPREQLRPMEPAR